LRVIRPTASRTAVVWLFAAMCLGACAGSDASTSPSPSERPTDPALVLIDPGETQTIEAIDAEGSFGTITIRRGEDLGGYPTDVIDPETFVIEVFFTYKVDRHPTGEFGSPDWAVATGPSLLPVGGLFEAAMPPNPEDFDPERQQLGVFPGAMEVTGERIEGMLYFLIPRESANEPLLLVYRPDGRDEAIASLRLRDPGAAPDPIASATPVPTPEPVTYGQLPGHAFTVIQDAEADALFDTPDQCTNPVAGYTVTYPDAWFTNTAIGETPACSWFSPTDYVVDGPEVPDEVAIVITVYPGALGSFNQPDYALSEEVDVGGFPGYRSEQIGVWYEGGAYEALPPTYSYGAILSDEAAEGPALMAWTSSQGHADYVLNKAVLDRIMASIRFGD
jgi:hypothetical protein